MRYKRRYEYLDCPSTDNHCAIYGIDKKEKATVRLSMWSTFGNCLNSMPTYARMFKDYFGFSIYSFKQTHNLQPGTVNE